MHVMDAAIYGRLRMLACAGHVTNKISLSRKCAEYVRKGMILGDVVKRRWTKNCLLKFFKNFVRTGGGKVILGGDFAPCPLILKQSV